MGDFPKGGVHKINGLWWVIFQRGEYTKPMGFNGWFFTGGSTWNRWALMGDFPKGGVHNTDGFWSETILKWNKKQNLLFDLRIHYEFLCFVQLVLELNFLLFFEHGYADYTEWTSVTLRWWFLHMRNFLATNASGSLLHRLYTILFSLCLQKLSENPAKFENRCHRTGQQSRIPSHLHSAQHDHQTLTRNRLGHHQITPHLPATITTTASDHLQGRASTATQSKFHRRYLGH